MSRRVQGIDGLRVLVRLHDLILGGEQINAVDFAAQLREYGVVSHLIAPRPSLRPGPSVLDVAEARGLNVELYDPSPHRLAHARQLSAFADRVDADLVHVYAAGGGARQTFWGPAFGAHRPWIQTVYEMSVSWRVYTHMPLVVGTGYLIDELQERPGRTVLISPPVDVTDDHPAVEGGEEFRQKLGATDEILLTIVSRLSTAMKAASIETAILAMAELSRAGATLAIVGTGGAEGRLRERAAEVNDSVGKTAVHFVGPMADPRPAYAGADIVLGMGSSAARALAIGKPLVAQGEAGWSAVFEPTTAESIFRSSFWSPEQVPDAAGVLARNLAPLLHDVKRREQLGDFGRQFAVKRFGLPSMSNRLAELYDYAMGHYTLKDWAADLPKEATLLMEDVVRATRRVPGLRRAAN